MHEKILCCKFMRHDEKLCGDGTILGLQSIDIKYAILQIPNMITNVGYLLAGSHNNLVHTLLTSSVSILHLASSRRRRSFWLASASARRLWHCSFSLLSSNTCSIQEHTFSAALPPARSAHLSETTSIVSTSSGMKEIALSGTLTMSSQASKERQETV